MDTSLPFIVTVDGNCLNTTTSYILAHPVDRYILSAKAMFESLDHPGSR